MIDNSKKGVEGRLNGIAPVDRDIAMQDLLKDFRVRNQSNALAQQIFENSLRVNFVRVRGPKRDTSGCSSRQKSSTIGYTVAALYLYQHIVDVCRRVGMPGGRAYSIFDGGFSAI